MPIVNIKISAQISPELTTNVSSGVSKLTEEILKKKPDVTAMTIQYINPEHWIIGGRSLAEQGKNSFYLDIKITDETNTKVEKALYLSEVYKLFSELLGNLHEVSYVYIEDVRAGSYGYAGHTQEYRFHQ